MAVVTQTQRTLLEAIRSLEDVERALQGKLGGSDLGARLDAMIEELTALVGRMGEGRRGAAQDMATATQALNNEGARRGMAQRTADRC